MKRENDEVKKRREERIKRDAERFRANLRVTRPGFGGDYSSKSGERIEPQESLTTGEERINLSGILWLDPARLRDNPYNEYPPLSPEELAELVLDIQAKGVLVPLIVRVSEDVLICGHNRRRASIEAKEPKVPVQRVLRLLTEEEEREIMRSENDRRRGGNWTKEKKEEFIREHFGDAIHEERRGAHKKATSKRFTEPFEPKDVQSVTEAENSGKRFSEPLIGEGSNATEQDSMNLEMAGKKFSEPLADPSLNLAKEIEKKSRGNITEGTAKRIIADMRKEKRPAVESVEKARESLSEKERKRGEKLALQLKTLRNTKSILEEKLVKLKAEEKRVLKELKTIGQPELFGVEP